MTAALPPIIAEIEELRGTVALARSKGRRIGFVPTMGALHLGHAQLIKNCRRDSDLVVVSIFVNPTQFAAGEDYERYPQTLESDRVLCGESGADLIFRPTVGSMYPYGQDRTIVEVQGITSVLEGASRPTHFRGVATVVAKLLLIVQPDLAHFGEKDFQQLLVIRRLVADLNIPVRIVGVPTVRDPDGLALSSRNRYLAEHERKAALSLSRALRYAARAVVGGERSAERVRQILRATIKSEPLVQLDYAEVADAETLQPMERLIEDRPARALLAARIGPARLIDNTALPFATEITATAPSIEYHLPPAQ